MLLRLIRSLGLALLLLPASLLAQTVPLPVNLVHQAMDQVLVETGNPFLRVIKQGSWITGGDAYRNPLTMLSGASDHDARLFISLDDVPPEQARAAWLNFKRRLQGKVMTLARGAGLSVDQTQLLLRSINLYPPAQVLKDIANNEEALAAFWRSGNYPNLLEVGDEAAEGIYTKATKFIRQRYEMGSRVSVSALVAEEGDDVLRLVRRDNANLEHMIEGLAAENFEGYVQATEYTMVETQKAIRQGNLDAARKNLKRMEEYHRQARRLGGVRLDGNLQRELDLLKRRVDELAALAFSETAEGKALLQRTRELRTAALARSANVELAALEGLSGRTAIRERAFYKGLLEGEGKWNNLRNDLELASERVIVAESGAARLIMKHWITGLFALWELKALPEAVQKEGAAKATARLSMTIASLASVHVAIADIAARAYMWVGELLVEFVSSYGYEAAVAQQDCNDLIAGLYRVAGREANVTDRTSCEQVPSDRHLACRVYDQHLLRQHLAAGRRFDAALMPPLLGNLITCHATAAAKKYDDLASVHDGSIVRALVAKCTPTLAKVWLDSRQLVVSEIDAIRQSIAERPLRLQAQPAQLRGKGQVRFTAQETMNVTAAEKDIASRAACLGGTHAEPRFLHTHLWTVDGRPFANTYDKPQAELNLTAPGHFEVCVTQQVDWRVAGLPVTSFEDGLQGRIERRGCARVTVDPDPVAPPPAPLPDATPKPPPPPAQAPSCSVDYTDWGPCDRASKTQTRSVKALRPPGCVERAKPVLEQACTPPPSDQDKRNTYFNCLCRCSSGWAGHIGVWYDPEQKTVPECKSSGPCIGGIGAFGCSSRHFFNSSTECAKGCWESAFGKDTWDAGRAAQLAKDENRKFKKPLAVKITASKNPAEFGDVVSLSAAATDGAGGYRFSWGGCAQDAKEAAAKVVNTRSCNSCQASVSVTDADGDTASDSLTVRCAALRVRLTREAPAGNRIPMGGKASFLAEVFSGDKPATGSFTYRWERNPDVLFGDPRNPSYETQGGAQSRHSGVFRRPGTVPVWVTVLKDVDGRKATMGESEQIVFEVVRPRLALTATPREVLVGQEVRLDVQEDPRMGDEMVSFWWELAGDATNAGPVPNVPNGRAYSFKPTSDRPVTVTVHAKSRDGGDDLGSEKLTVVPLRPGVNVVGPRIAGPAPMIWKEGVGLVPAGQQIAEGQRVEFSVTVMPAPAQEPRYVWSLSPAEGCVLSAPASRETGVTCSRAGGYAVNVAVRNADGANLGTGSGSLTVSITAADLGKGRQKDEASKKLAQVQTLWGQGRIDEAVATLEAAVALDKGLAAPAVQQTQQSLKKLAAQALQQGDVAGAIKRLEQALRLGNDADARQQLQEAQALAERQKQALLAFEAARTKFAQGQPADTPGLTALAADLQRMESVFVPTDPRRKPISELLAAVRRRLQPATPSPGAAPAAAPAPAQPPAPAAPSASVPFRSIPLPFK